MSKKTGAAAEAFAGNLGPLICIEDFGIALALQGLLENLRAEVRVQGVGDATGADFAAVPVHDSHLINKPTGHGGVSDIYSPHLIGVIDGPPLWLKRIRLCRRSADLRGHKTNIQYVCS